MTWVDPAARGRKSPPYGYTPPVCAQARQVVCLQAILLIGEEFPRLTLQNFGPRFGRGVECRGYLQYEIVRWLTYVVRVPPMTAAVGPVPYLLRLYRGTRQSETSPKI